VGVAKARTIAEAAERRWNYMELSASLPGFSLDDPAAFPRNSGGKPAAFAENTGGKLAAFPWAFRLRKYRGLRGIRLSRAHV